MKLFRGNFHGYVKKNKRNTHDSFRGKLYGLIQNPKRLNQSRESEMYQTVIYRFRGCLHDTGAKSEFTPVPSLWCGRTVSRAGGRCTVTWLPNFLGWVGYFIFLPMVLRWRALRARAPLKITSCLRERAEFVLAPNPRRNWTQRLENLAGFWAQLWIINFW